MQIELYIEGGFGAFPGLAKPLRVDSAALRPDRKAELQRLLEAAEQEAASRDAVPPGRTADARRYRVVVHGDSQRREFAASEPAVPPALAALISFIKANGRR